MRKYRVWCPGDYETVDSSVEIEAIGPGYAAEEYAEQECASDPAYYRAYIDEGGRDTHVQDEDGKVHKFHVMGEPEVTLHALEKTEG